MNKEVIIARKLKIFSVDKEIKEKVTGNPPTNRGNVNMNKEIKQKVAGNRGILNIDKEIIKEGRNPPTNLENINIDKENVAGSSPTNRGILNMIKKKWSGVSRAIRTAIAEMLIEKRIKK